MKKLDWKQVDQIIVDALNEDTGDADVTSLAMDIGVSAEAIIVCKQAGVLAGIDVCKRVFDTYDSSLQVSCLKKDGDDLKPGDVIMEISGMGHSILTAERTALNIIGRMSGIASMTRRFTDKVTHTHCQILDTRKTMPNLRIIDKYSVSCGGGTNHRFGLYDMILIKENHIRWSGSLENALTAGVSFARKHKIKIEAEVTNLAELKTALAYRLDMVMLDHFSLEDMKKAVEMNTTDCKLEASGNVTLDKVKKIAETGVDYISVGALTHSVETFDFSLLFM